MSRRSLMLQVCALSLSLLVATACGSGSEGGSASDVGSVGSSDVGSVADVGGGGVDDAVGGEARVVVNELRSSGDDEIELYNAGGAAADLSGWRLTDDVDELAADDGDQPGGYLPGDDTEAYDFPAGTTLDPGAYLVIEKGNDSDEHPFGLSNDGDVVTLLDGAGAVVDQVVYGAGDAAESYCRVPDGADAWTHCVETLGDTNVAGEGPLPDGLCPGDAPGATRPEWWTASSHCRGAAADYDYVFPDDTVRRLDITIAAADYAAAFADLDSLLAGPGGGGGVGVDPDDALEPMWFPCTLAVDGARWTEVGMRFKGNSSLRSAYRDGVRKLSFRLEFDQFEDEHPELDDQRFYGFEEMTFSNGFKDPSLIRDKLAADIFRDAGIPAARGAFVTVWIDAGEGPVYWGLYTMIEDPSDQMLSAQFDDGDGNLYKPENEGARWAELVLDDFAKKTNQDDADWSDVEAAYAALHAEPGDDPSTWRTNLGRTFDVYGFLNWLALNQTMVNWDTYGVMAHNYYVYGDPSADGRLTWIPWDLNEALMVPRGGPSGRSPVPTSLLLDEVGDDWPLIRVLLDDPSFRHAYATMLAEHFEITFPRDGISAKAQAYHDLIAPHVVGPEGETAPYTFLRDPREFVDSLTHRDFGLLPHIDARRAALEDFMTSWDWAQ